MTSRKKTQGFKMKENKEYGIKNLNEKGSELRFFI